MDPHLRDLERRLEAAPDDAGLWAALARTRLRAGRRPAEALAAVREGLRARPASEELVLARDEALEQLWKDPRFRPLSTRSHPDDSRAVERRIVFSPDGAFVALASRGLVVLRVDPPELAGAGLPLVAVGPLAFAGEDLLVATPERGEVALFSPAAGRVKKRLREVGAVDAAAVSRDGARGVLVLRRGLVVRLETGGGRLVMRESVRLPLSFGAAVFLGSSAEQDEVVLVSSDQLVAYAGLRFEARRVLAEQVGAATGAAATQRSALVERGGALRIFSRESASYLQTPAGDLAALSPDGRAAIVAHSREGPQATPPRLVLVGSPAARSFALTDEPLACSALAWSPCGSRLALLRERPSELLLLEAV